jgi:hypothetical protein
MTSRSLLIALGVAAAVALPAWADTEVRDGLLYDTGSPTPRLPIGMFVEGGLAEQEDALEALAPEGISPRWFTPGGTSEVLDANERFMADADAAGIDVMLGLWDDNPAGDAAFNRPGIFQSPALLGYYHTDDADERLTPAEVMARDAAVKNVDATHVTAFSLTVTGTDDAAVVQSYANGADLLMGQSYPITRQTYAAPYFDAVRLADAAATSGAVPITILQTFNWADFNDPNLGTRLPTPDELRAMNYLSLAGGAKGVFYYTFNATPTPLDESAPDLFQVVADFPDEVQAFEQDVLLGVDTRILSGEDGLFLTTFENEGQTLVIAVNGGDQAASFDVALPDLLAGDGFDVFGDTSLLSFDGTRLTGTLGPTGVQVLRFAVVPEPRLAAFALPGLVLLRRVR